MLLRVVKFGAKRVVKFGRNKHLAHMPMDSTFKARWDSLKTLTREAYYHGSLDQALAHAKSMYELSTASRNDSLQTVALLLLGTVSTEPKQSRGYIEQAIQAAHAFGNRRMIVTAQTNMAIFLFEIGDVKGSYAQTREIMALADSTGYAFARSQAYLNLSQIYDRVDNSPKSVESLRGLLGTLWLPDPDIPKQDTLLNNLRTAQCYLGLARCYQKMDRPDSIDLLFREALRIGHEFRLNDVLLRGYTDQAKYYGERAETQPSFIPAMKTALDSAAHYLYIKSYPLTTYYKSVQAHYFFLSGDPKQCIAQITALLPEAIASGSLKDQRNYREMLHKAYAKNKQPAPAYENLLAWVTLNDSLGKRQTAYNLALYEVDRQVQARELQNLKLAQEAALLGQRFRLVRNGALIAGLFALLAAIFAFTWRRQARKNAQLNADLRQTNSKLHRFAQVVSHDILSNLNLILNNGNLLSGQSPTPQALSHYYEQTHSISQQLRSYCTGLLREAHKRYSAQGPRPLHDPMPAVREVLQRFGSALKDKNMSVELADLPPSPLPLPEVEHVFQNLISNALRYAGDNETPRVRIATETDGEGNSCWVVEDNGSGIAPEQLSTIFSTSGANAKGWGVGLTQVYEALQEYGLDIQAGNAPRGGAKFVIRLNK